ncbi:ER membrane protein complex subunit 7 homolog [Stomoxys calcitrans]|uniref:ER membrane protein complex subunit 7 homolog n=1 Tax=Stomoxys calcitrans TaxID=35570 RepID=UPI0027E2B96F|nr:ER membrane protein complex subunit 7 homolog [Stomoxys calcitrans]
MTKYNMKIRYLLQLLALIVLLGLVKGDITTQDELVDEVSGLYTIEGKVYPPEAQQMSYNPNAAPNNKWQIDTVLNINGGEYKGFIREDGSFIISSVPSGSYVVEIVNPDYYYEPVRVEINPKGKFRARKVNYIQPSQIVQVHYPLKLKALTRFKYFQTREQWKITDFLFSPMVLMMVLPLLLMWVLPKMVNDPETKKELENMQFPKMNNDMPEISEMITSLFTGGAKPQEKEKKPTSNTKQTKKRNQ